MSHLSIFSARKLQQKMKCKELVILLAFISIVGRSSEAAKLWSGDSEVTAIQGESVTLTWTVSLTDSDASKAWTYVKVLHAEGANTNELVTFQKTGEKTINNPRYSNRLSDMIFNVSQSGSVVTIAFKIANLVRNTDMKNYKALLGFPSDATTYPGVTVLTILVKPHSTEITINPENNSFCIGDMVNVTCKADGIPPPEISLFLNTQLLQKRNMNSRMSFSLRVKGQNNIECVPNNTAGIGQTRNKKLTVKEPPKITRCMINDEEVTSKSVNEGTRITMSCDVTGSKPLDITWSKEGEQSSLVKTKTLTIASVHQSNAGQYRAKVSNGNECKTTVSKNLDLTVIYLDKPNVLGNTYRIISSVNPRAQFKVTVDGNPPPSLTCEREGGLNLSPGNLAPAVVRKSKSMYFINIYATDDEEYYCKVRSAAGNWNIKLRIYKQMPEPSITKGTFVLKDESWTNDLSSAGSDAYEGLKNRVSQMLQMVYGQEDFVSEWRILGFVKGSVAVNFQVHIIANVTDPIILLKNAVIKYGGQLNGLLIDRDSIKKGGYSVRNTANSGSTKSDDKTEMKVGLGIGIVLLIILIVLVIVLVIWCYRKGKCPCKSNDETSGTAETQQRRQVQIALIPNQNEETQQRCQVQIAFIPNQNQGGVERFHDPKVMVRDGNARARAERFDVPSNQIENLARAMKINSLTSQTKGQADIEELDT